MKTYASVVIICVLSAIVGSFILYDKQKQPAYGASIGVLIGVQNTSNLGSGVGYVMGKQNG